MKAMLIFLCLCLALFQLTHSIELEHEDYYNYFPDEYPEETYDYEDEARSFFPSLFGKSIELMKKYVKFNQLSCKGPVCSSCINAKIANIVNKQGCFTVSYNGRQGSQASLDVEVNMDGKSVWAGSVNAGNTVPSCVTLPSPVEELCVQDVIITVGQRRRSEGDVCFTINFRSYGIGTRFCAAFRGGSLVPSIAPQLLKTD